MRPDIRDDHDAERALLRLLVRIDRRGPIGVVGRDCTTVSRQVTHLDEPGLVVREKADAVDRMREELVGELMADWTNAKRRDLAHLLKRMASSMDEWMASRKSEDAEQHRRISNAACRGMP